MRYRISVALLYLWLVCAGISFVQCRVFVHEPVLVGSIVFPVVTRPLSVTRDSCHPTQRLPEKFQMGITV